MIRPTEILRRYNIPDVLDNYFESHRYYHNYNHINNMLIEANRLNILTDELYLAILFHDIIYDPKSTNNEKMSADFFYQYMKDDNIKQAILETKDHKPTSELSKQLCYLDLMIVNKDFKDFMTFEHKIFKEYQFLDYSTYKEKRVKILKELGFKQECIDYVKYREPKIGLYCGSFNPFHIGHLNILEKAEKIFDKVIIARGINPDKNNDFVEMPDKIQYRQIEYYNGLLTDFIDGLNYDVTLVRGLRNSTDLEYEMTQYRFLQDIKPEIKVISVFSDKEFEHISSSAIRMLEKYGKQNNYLV